MWIVELALRRPYTFVVMSLLIVILGVFTILKMPTDIFPEIDIPVIAVIWRYDGISPDEMEQRITSQYERVLTVAVNDIEHIESQTLYGEAIVKIFFQPGARIEAATAQVDAASGVILRQMPPGTTAPFIMRYSATNVPIIWLSYGSDELPEQTVFDYGVNSIRPPLTTIPGAQVPYPYGGKQREVVVDLNPEKLFALGLSPQNVSEALASQNLILPAGTAKLGNYEFQVRLNSSPLSIADLNDIPLKTSNGATTYLRDVAHVRDGFVPQGNIAHVDGKKGVLQPVLKSGGSTLAIAQDIKDRLPDLMKLVPSSLRSSLLFDQSLYVRASVLGVVKEAAIAAGLTALMILLFLGSWRSTLIVLISIPLSILVSIVCLAALGQTLNVMTLGGMALAVGVLVDDATVEIENIHRNLAMRKPLVRAILDGASQIATPAFVSTLCICIVFVPVVFISGAAKSLFTPLSLSVVFAMLTSYLLSRTLIPTMVRFLLKAEVEAELAGKHAEHGAFFAIHLAFNRGFERMRYIYAGLLRWTLSHSIYAAGAFAAFVAGSLVLLPLIGRDFFPAVDAGQLRLHVRTPSGMRVEETEKVFGRVEEAIRDRIPAHELKSVIDYMGIPNSGINLALSDGTMFASSEGEILISLTEEHGPTAEYVKVLRHDLAGLFPDCTFFFQPPDIVTQILNFGLPAPIDIQVVGPARNKDASLALAKRVREQVKKIPGAVDVHLQQVTDAPEIRVDVDRTLAQQVGLSQKDVAGSTLVSLSSSGQTAPNFWLDPKQGIQYIVAVQTPQYKVDSISALEQTPIVGLPNSQPQLLKNLESIRRSTTAANITHYNILPTFDVLLGVQGTDLGSVVDQVDTIVERARVEARADPKLRGTNLVVRGQAESMQTSFRNLGFGLIFAILLVYLLMVVNFQSWLDPFIILMALPGALSGIIWMLFVTGTTLSVPALMGAIMSIGVATANSILLITFANDHRLHTGAGSIEAAFAAGVTRLRPVVMTATAMIVGMLPMSLGLGEGGEQNAPLGRAVIGGLMVATFATLFFVPIAYGALRRKAPLAPFLDKDGN